MTVHANLQNKKILFWIVINRKKRLGIKMPFIKQSFIIAKSPCTRNSPVNSSHSVFAQFDLTYLTYGRKWHQTILIWKVIALSFFFHALGWWNISIFFFPSLRSFKRETILGCVLVVKMLALGYCCQLQREGQRTVGKVGARRMWGERDRSSEAE